VILDFTKQENNAEAPALPIHKRVNLVEHALLVSIERAVRVMVLVRQIHKPVVPVPVVRLTPVQLGNSKLDHRAVVKEQRMNNDVLFVILVVRPTHVQMVCLKQEVIVLVIRKWIPKHVLRLNLACTVGASGGNAT